MKKKKTTKKLKSRKLSIVKKLPVNIYADGEVDNETVNVRKGANEQVVWHSHGDEFTVEFEVSPFANDTFVVPAGRSVSSGPLKPDAAYATYPYFVRSVSLAMSADPGLNVKP
jgi:hypothetical protein